jgi:isopentenyldiphosphate isomerase
MAAQRKLHHELGLDPSHIDPENDFVFLTRILYQGMLFQWIF